MSGVKTKTFDQFMTKQSDKWKSSKKDGTKMTVVLHSCRTGRVVKGTSYAKQLSADNPDVIVVAPTERVYFGGNKEKGPYEVKYGDEKGDYTKIKADGKPDKTRTDNSGTWNVYYGGNLVGTVNKQSDIKGEDLEYFKETLQGNPYQEAKQDNTYVAPTQIIEQ